MEQHVIRKISIGADYKNDAMHYALGQQVYGGHTISHILYDEKDCVIGIRTGDRGIDKNGEKKPNYEAGVDIKAKITIFGEGTRGSLTKSLISKFNLMENRNPQVWAIGVKELWKLPEDRTA